MNLSIDTSKTATPAKPARLTYAMVKATLAAIGVSINPNDWNEYRVNVRGADPEQAQFAERGNTQEDQQFALREALQIGQAMAACEEAAIVKAANEARKAATVTTPTKYRLGSSGLVYAPGIVAYAVNGFAFKSDRAKLVKLIADCWSIPAHAATALLSKSAPYEIENEAVVFTA